LSAAFESIIRGVGLFTGLVEEKARVHSIDSLGENTRIAIDSAVVSADAAIGDSISINGCCLTIVEVSGNILAFDAVPETLARTNLGRLSTNRSFVNLERAIRPDTRLGGHYVTGHIDGTGTIRQIEDHEDWKKFFVAVDESLARQMASKGSVAMDGISLTLVDVGEDYFSVVLIPHTLQVTTIGECRENDMVNIETDLLAKYVERQLLYLRPGNREA
jgi:riboflavin synthase